MDNRILDVVVLNHRLDPHETDLRVHVKLETITPTTEIRGRFTGPHSHYSSTIEIAYPWREVARGDHIELRVVIPEASWWEPQRPFLYKGRLELWEAGVFITNFTIRHGIRVLQLTKAGLRLNGRPLTLRGKMLPPALFTPDEAKLLHAQGFNALFASVDEMSRRDEKPPGASLWMLADDTGFFVLGSSSDPLQFVGLRHEIASYPSNFGWVFNRAQLPTAPPAEDRLDMFYGVNTSTPSHLDNVHFLVCHDHELGWLAEVELPKIVVAKRIPDPLPARADVIGWISAPTT